MSKSTRNYMTPAELDAIRIRMGCSWRDLSRLLEISYSTLQCYHLGTRGIPEEFADRVRAAARHIKKSTSKAINTALRQIDRDHPQGIRSEIGKE